MDRVFNPIVEIKVCSLALIMMTMCFASECNYWTKPATDTGTASKSAEGLLLPSIRNATLRTKQQSSENSLSNTPSLHNNLPACMNVTIEKEFLQHLKSSLSPILEGPDNETVNLCTSLSPQLFVCHLTRILPGHYRIVNYSLFLGNSRYASLGDYFIDTDGSAITCDTPIDVRAKGKSRCNYMHLHPWEYEILDNSSLYLREANIVINRPQLTVDSSAEVTLCYPLSIRFLNCEPSRLLHIKQSDTSLDPALRLVSQYELVVYNLGEYLVNNSSNDVVVCISENARPRDPLVLPVHVVFYSISVFALLLTLICQYLASKSRCHDKCICCYVCSQIIYFLVLITIQYLQFEISHAACYTLFIVHYLSAMSTYFWMGISAFDVWKYFGHMHHKSIQQRAICENRRFIYYATFVWGVCILLCSAVITTDQSDTIQLAISMRPGIWNFCWFQDGMSTWIFYYGILILLMTLNLVFLIGIICHIYGTRKYTRLAKQRKIQILKICAKLFIIMGLCWVIRAVMYSIRNQICFQYWLLSEGITCLQGIAVFATYICSRDVYRTIFRYIRRFTNNY